MHFYHTCEYPLWMESIRQDNYYYALFYDAQIKEQAEKINYCPCCSEAFGKKPKLSIQAA